MQKKKLRLKSPSLRALLLLAFMFGLCSNGYAGGDSYYWYHKRFSSYPTGKGLIYATTAIDDKPSPEHFVTDTIVKCYTVNEEAIFHVYNLPTEGYKFNGWFTESDGELDKFLSRGNMLYSLSYNDISESYVDERYSETADEHIVGTFGRISCNYVIDNLEKTGLADGQLQRLVAKTEHLMQLSIDNPTNEIGDEIILSSLQEKDEEREVGDEWKSVATCLFRGWTDEAGNHYADNELHLTVDGPNTFTAHYEYQIADPTQLYYDGETFTDTTLEGVEMTFTVTSVAEKTCQVGLYYDALLDDEHIPAIPVATVGEVTVPSQAKGFAVTAIVNDAFLGCEGLTLVTLSEGIKKIGGGAFGGCKSLDTVVLPSTVEELEGYMIFGGCPFGGSGITHITIPKSVKTIGNGQFVNCSHLERVIVEEGNPFYDSREDCNAIIETESNTLIAACKATVIPQNVTKLGRFSYAIIPGLSELVIPKGVEDISGFFSDSEDEKLRENVAIWECPDLVRITVEKGNPIYDSRDNCNAIIKTASNQLVAGCMNTLIPSSVTSIAFGAFVAAGVMVDGFLEGGCSPEEVFIPASIKSFEGAFSSSYTLQKVVLEEGCKEISNEAFYGCKNLQSIIIPSTVTYVGEMAFMGCEQLDSIVSYIDEPFDLDSYPGRETFDYTTYENATLYVPVGSEEQYRSANGWEDFEHIVGFEPEQVPEGIAINATNFPDDNFRAWLLEQDYGLDGMLMEEEIAQVKIMSLEGQSIASLQGIEYFTAVERLNAYDNQLTSLDLTYNTNLRRLIVYGNQISSLNVFNNKELSMLSVGNNQLASIDLSNNTELETLYIYRNQLTDIDVSNNTKLKELAVFTNQLTSLDISKNAELEDLSVGGNRLEAIDVSQNKQLESLSAYANQLTSLDVSYNIALEDLDVGSNQLKELDVSRNKLLESLSVYGNQLSSLDVSKNRILCDLDASGNKLTSIDVSNNIALEELDIDFNQLTVLDVSRNTALGKLYVDFNQLTTLDVSKLMSLKKLSCRRNLLTCLEVSNVSALQEVDCSHNRIDEVEMGKLVDSLPTTDNGELIVFDKTGVEKNVINTEQVTVAKTKGWKVLAYLGYIDDIRAFEEYEGSVPVGIDYFYCDKSPKSIFNLAGQRLIAPKNGINIINGKKVVVK